MAEFINTVDVVGDEALTNSIIDRSIAEYNDSNVKAIGNRAFHSCAALTSIDLPAVTSIGESAFCRCSALVNVNIPIVTNIDGYAFENCASLKIVDLPSVTSIGDGVFLRSSAFATLILRNTKQCAALLGTSVFKNTPIQSGTGYIYVPRDLVDSYKSATNWSTYANQFRAIEDYTIDGTVTGEMDIENRRIVRFFNNDGTLLGYKVVAVGSDAVWDGDTPVYSDDPSWAFKGFLPEPTNVTADMDCYAQYQEPFSLETASWAEISEISAAGEGANYFSVGDTKSVALKGTMGTLALNDTYFVYILGFNHNSEVEGTGIQFGGFKSEAGADGKNICLVNEYNTYKTDGTKIFNMNHWGSSNRGGWAACDMRYDTLGSTDVAPSGYGSSRTSSSVGYDATATCATNPVANTLMSCLPADLRAVMKPITKYTDNVGGDSGHVEANVTASVDYLPLLGEMEIFGTGSGYNNNCEDAKQVQYEYFASGNFKVKYRHSDTASTADWWERSPYYSSGGNFCFVNTSGNASHRIAGNSHGVAPAFMV